MLSECGSIFRENFANVYSLFGFLYRNVIQYSCAKLILPFTHRQRAVSVQIVKDASITSVINELRENKSLITSGSISDTSDTILLQQYVKLMYNVRIGLVLLLLKKDESIALNDVRSSPLFSIIA